MFSKAAFCNAAKPAYHVRENPSTISALNKDAEHLIVEKML